jgi:hypothetical protein
LSILAGVPIYDIWQALARRKKAAGSGAS